ncbi:MAG: type 2 isopentenyl-diphosphate Delta-isomerase [Candidatus Thermoplasmatota archaeon]|nr:type 2 isopentenyl-diphosphate Delta-isomerase [Candidatus Thermoplasmatota archaeon]
MKRKEEHVEIAISQDVQNEHNYWNDLALLHSALPEIDARDIDTGVEFFGKKLSFPFIIAAMTGGYEDAKVINENLARAAEKLKVGFGIGSERAIFKKDSIRSYSVVKKYDVPVKIANIGAPQLIDQGKERALKVEDLERIIDIIDANFLAIHLNFLQEIVQPGGETRAKGILDAIGKVVSEIDVPVIVKETGGGISKGAAEKLKSAGVKCIDVGGAGGTSFSAMEHYRAVASGSEILQHLGKSFWNWGIPSPISLMMVRGTGLKVIATGGIRSGIDVAKALALGADVASAAYPFLKPATRSYRDVVLLLQTYMEGLRSAMFLQGLSSIEELRSARVLFFGRLREWRDELGLSNI